MHYYPGIGYAIDQSLVRYSRPDEKSPAPSKRKPQVPSCKLRMSAQARTGTTPPPLFHFLLFGFFRPQKEKNPHTLFLCTVNPPSCRTKISNNSGRGERNLLLMISDEWANISKCSLTNSRLVAPAWVMYGKRSNLIKEDQESRF